jgi:hypothetical protein
MDRHRGGGRGGGPADSPLAAAMQGVSLGKPDVDDAASRRGDVSPGHGHLVGYQVHPHITMYPIIYHPHLSPGVPYVLGHGPLSNSPVDGSALPHAVASLPHALNPGHPYETSPHFRGSGYGRLDGRRQNAYRSSRGPYYATTSHHNHVDVNRIRDGIDVRTTVSSESCRRSKRRQLTLPR